MSTNETAEYIVKDSGVRCITVPCPVFNAYRAGAPDAAAIPVHELDLSAVTGGDQSREEPLRLKVAGEGLKVAASLGRRENAGPAGAATVLRVSKVVEG